MSLTTQACRRVISLKLASSLRQYSVAKGAQAASSSKASSSSIPSHHTLPPAKMRALIALYHQSENWITEDNLLERIDATFVPDVPDAFSLIAKGHRLPNIDDFEKKRAEMKMAPKMAQWEASTNNTVGSAENWSGSTSPREAKVIEALYGVNVLSSSDDRLLPGLEVLQEVADVLDRKPDENQDLNAPPRKAKSASRPTSHPL